MNSPHALEQKLCARTKLGWAGYLFLKYLALESRSEKRDAIMRSVWEYMSEETKGEIRAIRETQEAKNDQ